MKKSFTSFLKYFFRSAIILFLTSPLMILLVTLETEPTIPDNRPLTSREISALENLILNLAPESLSEPSLVNISMGVSDISLLLRHSLQLTNLSDRWNVRVLAEEKTINYNLNWRLPLESIPLYVNLRGSFRQENDQLKLYKLGVGNLQIPDSWTGHIIEFVESTVLDSSSAYNTIERLLEKITIKSIASSQINMQLNWEPEFLSELSDHAQRWLISSDDKERIIRHYLLINDIVTTIPVNVRAISMVELLETTFAAVYENSVAGADPLAENRTLLQTLAIYVNNEDIAKLIGADAASDLPKARFIEVRLFRRQDLAQHVASVAAITASLGPELAALLSTTKETYDARYRSGFSFSDLTANSVGVALASRAMQDRDSAIEMQKRLSELKAESDFMPEVGNNRDGLPESTFNAIYADSSSTEYIQRMNEIREAIEAKPIFQGL